MISTQQAEELARRLYGFDGTALAELVGRLETFTHPKAKLGHSWDSVRAAVHRQSIGMVVRSLDQVLAEVADQG